ncbi:MAG: hypothetical protein PWQ67_626 [Clostridia bacterium]|nr:hypothetical protein [Clostridia bacterium]
MVGTMIDKFIYKYNELFEFSKKLLVNSGLDDQDAEKVTKDFSQKLGVPMPKNTREVKT